MHIIAILQRNQKFGMMAVLTGGQVRDQRESLRE